MTKKRPNLLAFIIAFSLAFSVFAPINASAATASSARSKMDSYVSFLKGKGGSAYWNAGSDETTLKQAISNGNLNVGLGTHECSVIRTSSSVTHSRTSTPVTCTSNVFGGGSQCHGFAKYFSYYLYGSYPKSANSSSVNADYVYDSNWTYYHKDKGTTTCPALQTGDFVRYNRNGNWHTIIAHYIKDGRVYLIDCNHSSATGGACIVTATETNKNLLNLKVSEVETAYKNGKAYICRYNGTVTGLSDDTIIPPTTEAKVSTNAASNITATSAQLNGSLSANGNVKITEHGAYLGTSTYSMTQVAKDENLSHYKSSLTMFYSTTKYGIALQPNTTYYYYQYAIVDGKQVNGSVVSFTTLPDPTPTPVCTTHTKGAYLWAEALHPHYNYYTCSVCGEKFTDGSTATSSSCTQCKQNTTPPAVSTTPEPTNPAPTTPEPISPPAAPVIKINTTSIQEGETATLTWANVPNSTSYEVSIWSVMANQGSSYTTTDTQYVLSGLTEGIYQFEVYAKGSAGTSEASNFIRLTVTGSGPVVSVKTTAATNITATSAQLNGTLTASGNVHIRQHGVAILSEAGTAVGGARDTVDYNKSSLTMFYNTAKYGIQLQPNTTYYYYQYALVNDTMYFGETLSFTTPSATNTSTANTRIGIITGTPGALAINDKPAASPQNSTQIGRIPEGASCTVYPSKTSGNWYWVEYNGVSGYAYKNYISLR